MVYCALIKTHHISSRSKIKALCKASKAHRCSVLIKSGQPGVMIAEAQERENLRKWTDAVKARFFSPPSPAACIA